MGFRDEFQNIVFSVLGKNTNSTESARGRS